MMTPDDTTIGVTGYTCVDAAGGDDKAAGVEFGRGE